MAVNVSNTVNEMDIIDKGISIGAQVPERATKFMYYELFRYNGKIYAVIFDRDRESCGCEEITEAEISQYLGTQGA